MAGLRNKRGTEEEEQRWDQEAFEHAYTHLMHQGARSCLETPRDILFPAYYGRYGLRCPVGCFIPVAQYSEEFERVSLERVYRACPALHHIDLNLLWTLRGCHDDLTPPCWKKRLSIIARNFRLVVTPALEAMPLRKVVVGPIEYYGGAS